MKTLVKIVLPLLLIGNLVSCKDHVLYDTKPGATGRAYDVMVIMPDSLWNGPAGDTLKSILTENPMILNQAEPLYTVYQADAGKITNLLYRHRNIVLFQVGRHEQPSMTIEYDVYSKPQAVVRITGPSSQVVTDYMDVHRFALQEIFDMAERDRTAKAVTQFVDTDIRKKVRDEFGVSINIPRGYTIRSEHPDFIWISYETPVISQGVVIYKYPLSGRSDFTVPSLVERRNEFMSLIPGWNKGSYMQTAEIFTPMLSLTSINNRMWLKLTGLWDLNGGFMGGPFTSYSTANTTTNEMVTVDLYVYSPKHPKRNYVKYLEGIMHTSRIVGDTTGTLRWEELVQVPLDDIPVEE